MVIKWPISVVVRVPNVDRTLLHGNHERNKFDKSQFCNWQGKDICRRMRRALFTFQSYYGRVLNSRLRLLVHQRHILSTQNRNEAPKYKFSNHQDFDFRLLPTLLVIDKFESFVTRLTTAPV